jgi:hypothetical protein
VALALPDLRSPLASSYQLAFAPKCLAENNKKFVGPRPTSDTDFTSTANDARAHERAFVPKTRKTIMRDLPITVTFLALTLVTWSLGTSPEARARCSENELALGYQPNKQLLAPRRTFDADFQCRDGKQSGD